MSEKIENTTIRRELIRSRDLGFDDLVYSVVGTFYTYKSLEEVLNPYITRNLENSMFVLTEEWLKENVKKHKFMSTIMYKRMIESVIDFNKKHKSHKRIPACNPFTHRSFHLAPGLFSLKKVSPQEFESNTRKRTKNTSGLFELKIDGITNPVYVENLNNPKAISYIILRPMNLKQTDRWEAVFYNRDPKYMIEHVDV